MNRSAEPCGAVSFHEALYVIDRGQDRPKFEGTQSAMSEAVKLEVFTDYV